MNRCLDCNKSLKKSTSKRCYSCSNVFRWKNTEYRIKLQKRLSETSFWKGRKNIKHGEYMKGIGNPSWKGGISSLQKLIRRLSEYKEWRNKIFQRDNWRCQECFCQKNIEAHHEEKLSLIFQRFLKEYSQFSPIEDKETLLRLAISYKPFWDSKGKTLCKKCHDKYGVHQ